MAEFKTIAQRLQAGGAMFFGRGELERLEAALRQPGIDAQQELGIRFKLVRQYLRFGETDRAVREIEIIDDKLRRRPAWLEQNHFPYHRLRGLVYLRQAEVENCVARHNAQCCLFPLQGGGVHTVRDPADEARQAYESYLSRNAGDLEMRWLLNITHMMLGTWPDDVPAGLVIPATAFESARDVGRFENIQHQQARR